MPEHLRAPSATTGTPVWFWTSARDAERGFRILEGRHAHGRPFPPPESAMKLAATALSLLACLATPPTRAGAQTGPWSDGELLVRTAAVGSLTPTIYRVVPETGATAVLTTFQASFGWTGAMVFDSYRGGLLSNMSLPPDASFIGRLWLVAHDGTAAAMPGFTGHVRALASAGDGRVFFIRHTGASQGPKTVEYFDAGNVIRTLKDTDGVSPFQIEVEHLLYHAPSNALIGSSSNWWSATDCAPAGDSLYRIPLSPDGLQVDGPVTCTSTSALGGNEDIVSLDHLPGGNVLVTMAFTGGPYLRSLNPVTLALTEWADPTFGDINGGVWSARLGRAVIHAGPAGPASSHGLRRFSGGQSGAGDLISTSIPISAGSGFSPVEILFEVDVNGPTCDGFQIAYGAGLAGKNAVVPLLGAIGCPDAGSLFTLSISSVVGGAVGGLFVGLQSAALPFKGGTLHLVPLVAPFTIAVGGAPGVAGAGSLALPAVLDASLIGIDLYLQAGFLDAAAVQGVSLTNGLRLQAG
jgi:hypothetical protein